MRKLEKGTSHFRVQYAACLLALGAFFLLERSLKIMAIFAGFAAANLILLAPFLWGAKPAAQSDGNKLIETRLTDRLAGLTPPALSFHEQKRPVANYSVASAGNVAGIAKINTIRA